MLGEAREAAEGRQRAGLIQVYLTLTPAQANAGSMLKRLWSHPGGGQGERWHGREELGGACQKGSRAPEVTERHGVGLVQGGGLPRLYPSLTPQSGAERAGQALGILTN